MVHSYNHKLSTRLVLIGLLLAAFGLRAYYARAVHPFEDEFTSMLASQAVQRSVLPILPSGLLYAQGLPYSIVNALYVGLVRMAGNGSLPEALQVPYRLPSVFISLLIIALLYRMGRDWFSPLAGLIAAGVLALAPIGIMWGARVRMYGLAMCLTLLLLYGLSRAAGTVHAGRWRAVTLVTLIAAPLNHLSALLLIPPLLAVVALEGWHRGLLTRRFFRPWSIRTLAAWGLAVGLALVGSVLLIFGWLFPNYGGADKTGSSFANLISRVHISLNWGSANKFLTGLVWDNTFNLPVFAVALGGGLLCLLLWLVPSWRAVISSNRRWGILALFVLSIGPLFESLFYLRDDRYLTPFLPLIFLLAGLVVDVVVRYLAGWRVAAFLAAQEHWASAVLAMGMVAVLGEVGRGEISKLFYDSPPAYEQALYFVKRQWQPGDVIVIPFPPASGMYLGRTDYFAADVEAQTKLLDTGAAIVDKWWGAPWIERGRQLQDVLRQHSRVWFVVDVEHYRAFFRADWHFVEQQNMKLAWAQDNALVYVSRKPGIPLPDKPEHVLDANLSDIVRLHGYTNVITGSTYRVFLFWKALSRAPYDFTQFVHIRNQAGETVAQADFQPLKGEYPMRYWRPGEVVVDVVDIPIPAGAPAGEYRVLAGLYRWDTLERLPVTADTTGENAVELERIALDARR